MTNEDKVAVKQYKIKDIPYSDSDKDDVCYFSDHLKALAEKDKRIEELEKENRKIRDDLIVFEDELERIRKVAERLRDSDDENEISLEENIAGRYMLKVLDGENFS